MRFHAFMGLELAESCRFISVKFGILIHLLLTIFTTVWDVMQMTVFVGMMWNLESHLIKLLC